MNYIKLNDINDIAEAISLRLNDKKTQYITDCLTINLIVGEENLNLLNQECFQITKQDEPLTVCDELDINIGNIKFKINK